MSCSTWITRNVLSCSTWITRTVLPWFSQAGDGQGSRTRGISFFWREFLRCQTPGSPWNIILCVHASAPSGKCSTFPWAAPNFINPDFINLIMARITKLWNSHTPGSGQWLLPAQVGLSNNQSLVWPSEFSLDKLPQKSAHHPSKCRKSSKSNKSNTKVFLQQSWEETLTSGEEKMEPQLWRCLPGTPQHQHSLFGIISPGSHICGDKKWRLTLQMGFGCFIFLILDPRCKRKLYWICILTHFYFLCEVLVRFYPASKYPKTLSAGKRGEKFVSLPSFQHFQMVNVCHCCVF